MLVTFISQCEKNALKKTRRVLDAFANRIGDNVWQTAITEQGLKTVKQLLRNSASRSTAVSCHRVRTRNRTELVWIVGNKRKFNELGYVPVNYTNKELFMDIVIETKNILANTKQQPLSQHLFAVGFLAYKLIEKMQINSPKLAQSAFIAGVLHDIGKLDPQFQQWLKKKITKEPANDDELFPTLPDDGVHIDTSITGHSKFTFEKHPRHNEISWLFAHSLLTDEALNPSQMEQIIHSIYWHHTRPFRKEKEDKFFKNGKGIYKLFEKSLNDTKIDRINEQVISVLKDVIAIAKKFDETANETVTNLLPKWNYKFKPTTKDVPNYKNYDELADEINEYTDEIKPNALNSLARTALISADRIVSKMSAEDLSAYIAEGNLEQALDDKLLEDSNLVAEINNCIDGFENNYPNSERNQKQATASDELQGLIRKAKRANRVGDGNANIGVLQGPAGCGKTKIALEWASKTNAQKIIWICPRVQVCLGLLNDLTQKEYLPNSRIEIFTGEYKKILTDGVSIDDSEDTAESEYFSGDIVITTIDQMIKGVISHSNIDTMLHFMQAHIVFDEFHELIPISAFNLLFAELLEAKKLRNHQANVLLVSATPHDFFVKEVLNIADSNIVRIDSFNQADYKIKFVTYDEKDEQNPLINNTITDSKTTFVITNTAQ
nr:CRISPR-associated endonuclease Cas3'' [Moraxellaceae bacterium]